MPDYNYCVALSITHPTLDPSDITEALGTKATRSRKFGEPRVSTKGKLLKGVNKESFWSLDLHKEKRLQASSIYLEDFISEQNVRFKEHEVFFGNLLKSGGYIEYFIGWFSTGNINMCITLSPELLLETAELHISVGICAYPE